MMFGLQRKGRLALAAATLAVGGVRPTGCSGTGGGTASEGGDGGDANLSITMLPKNLGNPYFDTSTGGAEEATEEFGGTFEEVGPSDASPTSQVQYIQTAAQQGAGGLIVSANDPEAICDALNEARDAGVKVVTFDADANADCRDLFINQATAEGIAKIQVDLIAEQIGDAGQIAVLSASANAANQNAWIEHDGGAARVGSPRHRARRGRLRRRRRPDLVRQDRGTAADLPGAQGHRLARPRSASRPLLATCRPRSTRARSH